MKPEDVPSLLETALALPGLSAEAEALRPLARDVARTRALGARPLRVALVGSTGAGKSTLLNALAGAPLAEEGTTRPTSRQAVAYAPLGADLGRLQQVVGQVVRYTPQEGGRWTGQVLVDTPDLNSVAVENRDRALDVLAECDVAVVVLHRGSVAEARPNQALQPFARRRALLLVLNHADQLGAQARATLSAQAARVAVEALGAATPPPVFVVSAARARDGQPGEDWEALVAALRRFAEEAVAAQVRGDNSARGLAELQQRVARGLDATRALEATVQAALTQGLDTARPALAQDFDLRLQAAAMALQAAVRRAAAARLSGPAAWGLRLSAWSGGGLLGGTLLARASLPAGLLVAATGAVLDSVQARTRARATAERMSGGGEPLLEAEARAALTPARAAAQRQGVKPALLGLPTPEAWAATLERTRAAAWRDAEGLGVEQAVARWWRWARVLLVPVVQLPLLVLLGDVAFRTLRAYLLGPLLDVRYYVNAAALALVWTATGTLLAGLSLAGVATRVRRRGAQRFAEGLAAAEASLQGEVHGALALPLAAAEALLAEGTVVQARPSAGPQQAP